MQGPRMLNRSGYPFSCHSASLYMSEPVSVTRLLGPLCLINRPSEHLAANLDWLDLKGRAGMGALEPGILISGKGRSRGWIGRQRLAERVRVGLLLQVHMPLLV